MIGTVERESPEPARVGAPALATALAALKSEPRAELSKHIKGAWESAVVISLIGKFCG